MNTKVTKVTNALEKMILSGHFYPGQRLDSMRALALRFHVSTMVIQLACRTLAERGLVECSSRSGVFIPDLKNTPRQVIGLLTDIRPCNMPRYYEELFFCINAARSIVIPVLMGEELNIHHMLSQKPAHILVDLEALVNDLTMVHQLIEQSNIIFFNRFEWDAELPKQAVLIDRVAQTEIALRYFLGRGHRKIVFLGHHDEPRLFKRKELESAAARCGLEFGSEEFLYCCTKDFENNPERLHRIFKQKKPTAIFSRSDSLLLRFVRNLTRVFPQCCDLDKVGCYNTEFSRIPGEEFASFDVHWRDAWQMAVTQKKLEINWITPTLLSPMSAMAMAK